MKTRLLPIFLVSILFSCTRTADIESVAMSVETPQQTVLPKISKDIDFLSADDAVKVANLFNHGNVLTKSETMKEVRDVVPVMDGSGRTLMYAVNYSDGYDLISATKKYHPVLAMVERGTYTGEKTNTGYDVIMNEYVEATQAAIDGKITIDGNPWAVYEEVPYNAHAQTKVSDAYTEVANEYIEDWYMSGYNIYQLNTKPENMSDEMYETFCDYARDYDRPNHDYMQCSFIVENDTRIRHDIRPMCTTTWGQGFPYNVGLSNINIPLGCTTIAAAQIMKAMKFPSSVNWNAMPYSLSSDQVNSVLASFLAELRGQIGVGDYDDANINQVYNALTNYYGYNLSIINHNIAMVESSLLSGKPVYMRGEDNDLEFGHAWVCDGYRCTMPQVEYYLYVIPMSEDVSNLSFLENIHTGIIYDNILTVLKHYRMNWGWYGNYNGYFLDSSISTIEGDYSVNRKELIIN